MKAFRGWWVIAIVTAALIVALAGIGIALMNIPPFEASERPPETGTWHPILTLDPAMGEPYKSEFTITGERFRVSWEAAVEDPSQYARFAIRIQRADDITFTFLTDVEWGVAIDRFGNVLESPYSDSVIIRRDGLFVIRVGAQEVPTWSVTVEERI